MRWLTAIVLRALLLTVAWVSLSGWDADYAAYGLLSVGAATALSLALLPPAREGVRGWPGRAWGSLRLAGWFLTQAAVGGADVAWRAVRRTPDIAPEVVSAPFLLPAGPGRNMAMLLMNLMPGTMVQRAGSDGVQLHTLALELRPVEQWEQLQRRVARAYGVSPTPGAAEP